MFGPCGIATWEILVLPIFPLSAFPDAISQSVPVLPPHQGEWRQCLRCHSRRPNQLAEVMSWPLSWHYHINTGTGFEEGREVAVRKRWGHQASSNKHTVSIASGVIRKLMARKEPSRKSSVVSSRDAAQPFTLSQPKSWPPALESAHLIAVLISQVWRVSFIAPMGLQLSRAEGYGGSNGAGS